MRKAVVFGFIALAGSTSSHPSEVRRGTKLAVQENRPFTAPKKLPFVKELVQLVEEKRWFFVFHKLYDFEIADVYSKKDKGGGSERDLRKRLAKIGEEEPKLKPIRKEIVFRYFLEKVSGRSPSSLCDEPPEAPLSPATDPIYVSLTKINRKVTREVYVEGFGGEQKYLRFLNQLGSRGDSTIQLPLGLGGWTKFCFSTGEFWLSQLGHQWASMLADRKREIDRVFAETGGKSVESLVSLGNWYIQHASEGGSLFLNANTARLEVKDGNYHLKDDASHITDLVIDGHTRTVTQFNWYLED